MISAAASRSAPAIPAARTRRRRERLDRCHQFVNPDGVSRDEAFVDTLAVKQKASRPAKTAGSSQADGQVHAAKAAFSAARVDDNDPHASLAALAELSGRVYIQCPPHLSNGLVPMKVQTSASGVSRHRRPASVQCGRGSLSGLVDRTGLKSSLIPALAQSALGDHRWYPEPPVPT